MAVFSERHRGYKMGVALLFLSVGMATWGVIAPGWMKNTLSQPATPVYAGLWFVCQEGLSGCASLDLTNSDTSYYATLLLSIMGLLFLMTSCIYVICVNWCARVISHSRSPHILAYISGLNLFVSCMVYVGDTAEFVTSSTFRGMTYGPSFALTISASLTSFCAGVIMSVYLRRDATFRIAYTPSHLVHTSSKAAHPGQQQQHQHQQQPGLNYPGEPYQGGYQHGGYTGYNTTSFLGQQPNPGLNYPGGQNPWGYHNGGYTGYSTASSLGQQRNPGLNYPGGQNPAGGGYAAGGYPTPPPYQAEYAPVPTAPGKVYYGSDGQSLS